MKSSNKAKTKNTGTIVSIDPAIDKTAGSFVVALWDETNIQRFVSLPDGFWSKNRKTGFPNVALFRPGDDLNFHSSFRWKRFADEAVFIVPTTPREMRVEVDDPFLVLQKRCCNFLAVSLRGNVPVPDTTPLQIIKAGFDGVVKTIELMWPSARRLIATSLSQPPKEWELFQQG